MGVAGVPPPQALQALRAHVPDADDDVLDAIWQRLLPGLRTTFTESRAALLAAASTGPCADIAPWRAVIAFPWVRSCSGHA